MKRVALLMLFSIPALAAQLPAKNCELFISKIRASPSSHGSGAIEATVKVGWIGNDEYIQRVGMVVATQQQDLGNAPSCHMGSYGEHGFEVIDPTNMHGFEQTEYGEYTFQFYVVSGSVVDQCPGFHNSHTGAFFVETNRNTYWLNPDLDANKNFVFDANGFLLLERQGFYTATRTADHGTLQYYNPLSCR